MAGKLKVRMLDVCNRKVPEHVTVKDAHKIYKHLFHEYGQGGCSPSPNEGVGSKAADARYLRLPGGRGAAADAHDHLSPPGGRPAVQMHKGELPYRQVAELLEAGLERLEEHSGYRRFPRRQTGLSPRTGGRAAPREVDASNIATASSRRS